VRRREFITLLGGAAGWPLAAGAQQAAVPVIGFISSGSANGIAYLVQAFRQGLNEVGFVEGRNVTFEYRFAENRSDLLPSLAADLVRRRVTVIAAPGSAAAALAAKAATTAVPIVFSGAANPVQVGLVASLNRPGGNVTGFTSMNAELEAKRIGLLHELLPRALRIALLVDSTIPSAEAEIRDTQAAATATGKQIEVLSASSSRDIETAFASLVQKHAEALLIAPSNLFTTNRVQIATLAARHAVPTIYGPREFAEAGGLMSYGSNNADQYRQVGIYTGRILKGEKPADLPVMQATKFEFVINLQTARALGINVPLTLLARADEVIE
jgi:putative tryptophan/tyrosine transport system substrate-binding protein